MKCPSCGGDKIVALGDNNYSCQYCGATFAKQRANVETATTAAKTRCPYCGEEILFGAQKCRHCGEWLNRPAAVAAAQPIYVQSGPQQYTTTKSRIVAALLAFFLGGLGIHEFYLGRNGAGIAFLLATLLTGWLVFPLFIIGLICLIQAISYLCMSEETFAEKYH